MRLPLIALRGISVYGENIFRGSATDLLWVDDCTLTGPGKCEPGTGGGGTGFFSAAWWAATHFTNCEVRANRNGIRSGTLIRNCIVKDISGSPFGDSTFVVNSKTDEYDGSGCPQFHGDVFHWFFNSDDYENVIVYGVEAYNFDNQGLFAEVFGNGSRMDNVAIVNSHISKDAESAAGSWWEVSTNHLLFWHLSVPDQPFRWAQSNNNTTLRNVSIDASVFMAMTNEPLGSNVNVGHVHYTNQNYYGGKYPGNDVSFGDPRFENPASGDYRLKSNSPLLHRITNNLRVNSNLQKKKRQIPASIGPFESSSIAVLGN